MRERQIKYFKQKREELLKDGLVVQCDKCGTLLAAGRGVYEGRRVGKLYLCKGCASQIEIEGGANACQVP